MRSPRGCKPVGSRFRAPSSSGSSGAGGASPPAKPWRFASVRLRAKLTSSAPTFGICGGSTDSGPTITRQDVSRNGSWRRRPSAGSWGATSRQASQHGSCGWTSRS
eukprot:9070383-Lingulodinium_polyedra.AAC.1